MLRTMWSIFTHLYCQVEHLENLEKTDRDRIENLQIHGLENGYLYDSSYFILVAIEADKKICLNDYCSYISEENW